MRSEIENYRQKNFLLIFLKKHISCLQTQVEELLADRDHLASEGIYIVLKGTLA
jgi:hypothetical protein